MSEIITDEVYKQYADKIVSVLKNDEFYEQYKKRVDKGSSSFKLAKKRLIQDISIDWISTIEDVLPNLDTIVRNPRKFIVQEEDIVDVSLARSISTESVKFLAQHTNMISKVDKDGMVTPSKILNITKEESFEIYENRFIYTLLLKLKDFVTMRYDKIKKASATQDVLELDVESRFNLPSKKVTMRTEYFAQLSFDEVMRLDPETLTKIERIAKIDRIITDFLSSSFAKSMRNSAPVRPPIMRTNVILKEPNFKKALTLWQFIETYNVTGGFSTSDEVEDLEVSSIGVDHLKNMVTLNTMLFESLYEQHETNMDMEDKEFGDFLRVGEMDFEKDKIDRDKYAQKLDNQQENEEEEEKVEEVAPQESENAERNLDLEQQKEQEEQKEPPKPDNKPQVEEREKEVEKEVVQEVEVERPVEVERYKEMAPKADQEEVDLEPDAEKFDQHLYDVRKLYKRPDSDRLKQEDIAKVKDAIDRCLTSYRRIKQEEIDERERADRIRRRLADIEKRAESFKKMRVSLDSEVKSTDDALIFFGIDPLSYQRAKLAAQKREQQYKEERDKAIANYKADERLTLEDRDTTEIKKSIDEMEKARARRNGEEIEQEPRKPKVETHYEYIHPEKLAEEITPVDESKVAVGGIRFASGMGMDIPDTFTDQAADISASAHHEKDAKPAKAENDKAETADEVKPESSETETPSENVEETPVEATEEPNADATEETPEVNDAPAEEAVETPVENAEEPVESAEEASVESESEPASEQEAQVETPEEPAQEEIAETSSEEPAAMDEVPAEEPSEPIDAETPQQSDEPTEEEADEVVEEEPIIEEPAEEAPVEEETAYEPAEEQQVEEQPIEEQPVESETVGDVEYIYVDVPPEDGTQFIYVDADNFNPEDIGGDVIYVEVPEGVDPSTINFEEIQAQVDAMNNGYADGADADGNGYADVGEKQEEPVAPKEEPKQQNNVDVDFTSPLYKYQEMRAKFAKKGEPEPPKKEEPKAQEQESEPEKPQEEPKQEQKKQSSGDYGSSLHHYQEMRAKFAKKDEPKQEPKPEPEKKAEPEKKSSGGYNIHFASGGLGDTGMDTFADQSVFGSHNKDDDKKSKKDAKAEKAKKKEKKRSEVLKAKKVRDKEELKPEDFVFAEIEDGLMPDLVDGDDITDGEN